VRRIGLAAAAAVVAMALAGSASAATKIVDFTASGAWWSWLGGALPYGVPANPVLTGSFTVDTGLKLPGSLGLETVTALNWTTGTKTWTLADANVMVSNIGYSGDTIDNFFFYFDSFNNLSNGGVSLADETNWAVCNGCVSYTVRDGVPVGGPAAVPELATWAMMLLGFFGLGSVLRRRRQGFATA
jgi:hypothetical protein